jgi:hypothetical protein
MKFRKQDLQLMFRDRPWLINPTGVIMILCWPVLLPLLMLFNYWEEVKELSLAYFRDAWSATTFTGFKDDE